jgi:hypothetical protein
MSARMPTRPTFDHFNLETARMQEPIDRYAAVVGAMAGELGPPQPPTDIPGGD